jgi:hypothetical protein
MYQRWSDAMNEVGLGEFVVATVDDVTVDYVEGGCYGSGRGIRPTVDSLMHSNLPVFGAVNRRQAEAVLALWPEPTPVVTSTTAPDSTTVPPPSATPPTSDPDQAASLPDRDTGTPWLPWLGLGLVSMLVLALVAGLRLARR